ncbi:MAG: hypothetical protein IKL44_07890 [Clostridia bacterium]|nr:hypothetical protein [Clostridia bacterium]
MTKKIKEDMGRSRRAFSLAKNLIEHSFDASLVTLEDHKNVFEQQLDQKHAIDGFLLTATDGVVPVAWRVRFDKKENCAARAFTVRSRKANGVKTEWQKLWQAQMYGDLMPQFIFSIYVDEENSPTVACVETPDLIDFIQSDLASLKRDRYGDEYFSCRWAELDKCGYLKYVVDMPF